MAGYVNIDPREIYFDASGGREFVEARIDASRIGNGWEIDTSQDLWCEIRIAEQYSTNTTISITAEENPDPEMRTLDVDIYFDGDIVDTLYIEQEAGEADPYSYSVSPTSLSYTSSGGGKTVTLSTDSPYSWSVGSKPSWITTSISGRTLTVNASANSQFTKRSGSIVVWCGSNFSQTISVSQDALQEETSISSNSITLNSGSGSSNFITLSANYNAEWDYMEEIEWANVSITNNPSTSATLTVTATATNGSTNNRTGTIRLWDDIGNEYTITVTQKGAAVNSYVTPTTITGVKYTGGTSTVSLNANWGANWTVSSKPSWVTTNITSNYTTSAVLTINVAENALVGSRSELITVKNENHTHTIRVTQDGAGWNYNISPTSLSYTKDSATKSVTLSSNGNATYTVSSKPDWVSVSFNPTTASSTVTASVTASANTSTDSRSGTITFTTNNGTALKCSVSQSGVPKTTSVNKTSVTVGTAVSSTASVSLTANYKATWSASEEIEWCNVNIKNNNTSSATLEITTTVANGSINTRSGNVKLTADNGDSYTIAVTQSASTPSSNVVPKDFSFKTSGGSNTASLTANWGAAWTVTSKPSWITTSIANNNTNNATLTITASANADPLGRSGTISISNNYHSFTIAITQDGAGWSYSIDPTSLSFASGGATKTSTITCNGNGSYTVKSKPDWCSVSFTNNNTKKTTVNVTASASSTTDTKTGTVKLTTNNGQELNISVSQAGIPKTTSIGATSVTIGSAISSTKTVTLTANYNCLWGATEEIEWCSILIKNNQSSSATLEITTTVTNGSINSRSGNINLRADNGDTYTVSLTQEGSTPSSNVSPQYFESKYEGETFTANLTANWGASWSVTNLPEWITSSISKNNTNNAVLTLNVSANGNALERVAAFVVKNDKHSFNVGLKQEGAGYIFNVSHTNLSFVSGGETKTSKITANGNGTYTLKSKPDWCTVSFTNNGTSNTTVSIKASASNTTDTRTGSVKLTTNDGQELYINVSQEGIPKETSIAATTATIGSAVSSKKTIALSANYNCVWGAFEEIEWCSIAIKDNESASATLEITATVNNGSINSRTGKINLVADNGDTYEVTVTQTGSEPYSNVIPQYFEVGIDGGSVTSELIANWGASWSVKDCPDWITYSISKNYTNNAVLTLNVSANTSPFERVATLIVKNDKHSFNVGLVQATGGYTYWVDPTSLKFDPETATQTVTITSNGSASYTIESKPDWIKTSLTGNNTASATVSVTANENVEVQARTGKIKIKTNDGSELSISVSQSGVDGETSITKTSVTLSKEVNSSATVGLNANYNCEWKLDDENLPEWVTASITDNISKAATLTITAKVENGSINERKGNVKVTDDYGNEYVIEVTQRSSDPYSNVVPKEFLDIKYRGETYVSELIANWGAHWSVTLKPEWVTTSISSNYTNNGLLTIVVSENTGALERSGVIVIANDKHSHTLILRQEGSGYSFVLDPLSLTFKSDGETKTSTITANGDGTYTVKSNPEWCTVSFTNNGTSNTTVNVTANKNTTVNERTGVVKITTNDAQELNLTVVQEAGKPTIAIDKTIVEIPKEGGYADVIITTNYNATFECSDSTDWISCELLNNGTNKVTLRITAALNDKAARDGIATITCLDANVTWSATINVLQKGDLESWEISPKYVLTSLWGGTYVFTVTANYETDWTLTDKEITFNKGRLSVGKEKVDIYTTRFTVVVNPLAYQIDCDSTDTPNAKYEFTLTNTEGHSENLLIEGLAVNTVISETDLEFDGFGGVKDVSITSGSYFKLIEYPDWLDASLSTSLFKAEKPSRTTQTLYINCKENFSEERTGIIKVALQPEGCEHYISITQMKRNTNSGPNAICEPRVISLTTNQAEYHLYKNDNLIYTGAVYKYPDESSIEFELNEILSNYLSNHIQFEEGADVMPDFMNVFLVQTETGYNNMFYTYNSWEVPKRRILNDPISNVVDSRQYVFVNYLDLEGTLTLKSSNGDKVCESDSVNGYYYASQVIKPCGSTSTYNLYLDGKMVDSIEYVYGDGTKDYVLYYVNAYGGWDSLLINGNVKRTDNVTPFTYRSKKRGKVKYMNEITSTWSLYTDDMNDGSKMYHLLESTEVYLHNLNTDEIIPVVITDSSCEYKTYANQGNKRFNYVINVEGSNFKYRK